MPLVTTQNLAAVVETFPINLADLERVLFHAPLWETVVPAREAHLAFPSETELRYEVTDDAQADLLGMVKIPVTLSGRVAFQEQGEGVIGFEALECEEVESFSGRIRYRAADGGTKIGIFVQDLRLDRGFIDKLGGIVKEVMLKTKLKTTFRNFHKVIASGAFARFVAKVEREGAS